MFLQTVLAALCVFSVYAEHGHIAHYNSYSFKVPDSPVAIPAAHPDPVPPAKVEPHAVYGVPEEHVKPFDNESPYPAALPTKPYPAPESIKLNLVDEEPKILAKPVFSKYAFDIPVTDVPKINRRIKLHPVQAAPESIDALSPVPSKYSFNIPVTDVPKILRVVKPNAVLAAPENIVAEAPVFSNYSFQIPVRETPEAVKHLPASVQRDTAAEPLMLKTVVEPVLSKYAFKIPQTETPKYVSNKPYPAPQPSKPYPAPQPTKPYPAPQPTKPYPAPQPTKPYPAPEPIITLPVLQPVANKYAFKIPQTEAPKHIPNIPNPGIQSPKLFSVLKAIRTLPSRKPVVNNQPFKIHPTEAPKVAPYPKPHVVYGVPQ